MPRIEDVYLGDGVYASFDGFSIILDLRGQDSTTRICLEPSVLNSLNQYAQQCYKQVAEDADKESHNV